MHASGEVTLPVGLNATATNHFSQFIGGTYDLTVDKEASDAAMYDELLAAVAQAAGLVRRG